MMGFLWEHGKSIFGVCPLSREEKWPVLSESELQSAVANLQSEVLHGVLAQLVEHRNGIAGVRGSNPLGSTLLPQSGEG